MAIKVFRFMDLPTEIRDQIYKFMLCTWQPKLTIDEKKQIAVLSASPTYHHKISTAILLTNHQISRDAFDILIKENLFVRLKFRGVPVQCFTTPKQVPIIAEGRVVHSFKGYVMTHRIRMSRSRAFPPQYMVILWRDLALFCQAFVESGCSLQIPSRHRVTIHNPFIDTSTPHYLNLRRQVLTPDAHQQERLLQPYREHLRGDFSFKVVGNVEPSLAEATTRDVKQDPWGNPQFLMQDMLRRRELGQKYLDEGNSNMAIDAWESASIKLDNLVANYRWPLWKADAGVDWTNGLAAVFYQINSDIANAGLPIMRQVKDQNQLARHFNFVATYTRLASTTSKRFGSGWEPTEAQRGENFYQLGAAYHRSRRCVTIATVCINIALSSLPNSSSILQEKEEIARWQAEISESGRTNMCNH